MADAISVCITGIREAGDGVWCRGEVSGVV